MPSKSRRAASRQAQLSGRRRRRGGRPRGEDAALTQVQQVRRQARPTTDAVTTTSTQEAPAAVQTRETTAPVAAQTRRRSARARAPMEPLQMYPYLGSELRRIGALTGLMVITLAVLTFVLG